VTTGELHIIDLLCESLVLPLIPRYEPLFMCELRLACPHFRTTFIVLAYHLLEDFRPRAAVLTRTKRIRAERVPWVAWLLTERARWWQADPPRCWEGTAWAHVVWAHIAQRVK
jgi:hypothetical protein